ncbi:MAG: gliding motility-associated-like protein [Flavobacteriales bacterium]|jgi:gliding motility-associated-like protein
MYKSLLSLLLMSLFLTGTSQEHSGAFTFVENKGQLPDQVSFKSDLRSGYLYLEDNGLLFNLYDPSTVNKYIEGHYNKELRRDIDELKWHSYKVNFVGGNFDSKKTGTSPTDHYYNFYLGADKTKWASKAFGYHSVTYTDIYKGIDFKMYSQLFNLKYDFIVAPNADPSLIKLEYQGADKVALIKGKLHIYTSVNHVIEAAPKVYQVIDGKQVVIPARYKLEGNVISYEILEDYDHSRELVIDPTLIFSTYSGSFSNNFGYSATFDSKGFLYSGSSAFGNSYPTVVGSYNTSFAGGIVDIAISKFDTSGTFLIYSTYIGGSSDELPHSLIVNSVDELFIFGTTSSSNYPTTANCYDNSYNGGTPNNLQNGLGVNYTNGSDIVVSRLSADGTSLQASTYIGGSANDGLNSTSANAALNILRYNYADEVRGEIDIDQNNNIYIATCTQSTDFPTTAGAFQTTYGGGALDGCVMKLDNSLQNMIWSSYIGGEKHDAVYALALDSNNDIYVTGGTESDSLSTTNIALDTSFQGGRADGFVTHIQSDGSSIINSTYIGSSSYDQSYFVELDKPGNVYLLGQTEVTDSTFVKNVTWSNFGSGQFVAKLSPQLDTLLYATVFGSGNGINISPTAFLVDLCNKMYLAGWGGAVNNLTSLNNNAGYTNGMPISTDAYQSTTDGSDFYIMVLEDDASGVVYGSYFGGASAAEHVDGGTSRFDRKGKVYQAMCAGCGSFSDMPIEPANALSPTNNSSCNLGVFKMDFDLPVVVADFDVPPLGCSPFNVNFTNTSLSQANTSFLWDFGDNTTGTTENPSHTYTSPGTYEITLIINDPATCNFGDTIQKEIIVLGDTAYSLVDINICPGDIEQIGIAPQSDPSITYTWTPTNDLSSDTISNPFANPGITTNYQLLISNGVCTDTVTQSVIVNTPILNVGNDTTLCDNSQVVTLTANSMGTSTNYQWSSSNQFLDTLNSPITDNSITVSPNQTTTYFVEINNNGCYTNDSVMVDIASGQLILSPFEVICEGDSALITATNLSASETFTFDWSPDSDILSGDGTDSIWVNPTSAQMFYMNAISSIGCTIEDSVFIGVDNLPSLAISVTANPDTIYAGNFSQLNALPSGYSYIWTPSLSLNDNTLQSPTATPDFTTTYSVTISGSGGSNCLKEGEVTVFVKEVVCGQPDVFVPNAFTPNSDGKNDVLRVRGNNIEFTLFRVYDRWGELVFETNDQSIGWDGTFKEKDCDPAVFVYYLDGVCIDGEEFLMKGNVSLIR